jgi:hypothetical protein
MLTTRLSTAAMMTSLPGDTAGIDIEFDQRNPRYASCMPITADDSAMAELRRLATAKFLSASI